MLAHTGIAALLALSLTACAVLTGTASYRYETRATDGSPACTVRIDSRRDIAGPAEVRIGKGCTLTVKTGSLNGGQMTPVEAALVGAVLDRVEPPEPQEEP